MSLSKEKTKENSSQVFSIEEWMYATDGISPIYCKQLRDTLTNV